MHTSRLLIIKIYFGALFKKKLKNNVLDNQPHVFVFKAVKNVEIAFILNEILYKCDVWKKRENTLLEKFKLDFL